MTLAVRKVPLGTAYVSCLGGCFGSHFSLLTWRNPHPPRIPFMPDFSLE